MNFVLSSYGLLMNVIWNEIKFVEMNLHAVRMKFIWTSYRRTNGVDMLYPCNTNEVDTRLINNSHEIHMKFIWISMIWTSCEPHVNLIRITWQVHKKFLVHVLHMNMVSDILAMYFIWMSFQVHRIITTQWWSNHGQDVANMKNDTFSLTAAIFLPKTSQWRHMMAMASQIIGVVMVFSTVCPGADQRKHQSSTPLAFPRENHRSPVDSPQEGPVTRKMVPFDDVIYDVDPALPDTVWNVHLIFKSVCSIVHRKINRRV